MASSVDPAILEALQLDPGQTKIASHGSSGFASSFKISSTVDNEPVSYFVKTGSGKDAEVMFRGNLPNLPSPSPIRMIFSTDALSLSVLLSGEHASLNAIHNAVPSFCPKSHAHGPMSSSGKFFLVTDFLDLGASSSTAGGSGSGLSLAAKLAKLHNTPAPIPEGFDKPMYGFPVTTCCGDTPQDNSWKESWADFYAENRLRSIYRAAERNHGSDREVADAVERTASEVVLRLLGDGRVKGMRPVIIHGDLWSGNHSRGQIAGQGGVEEVVYDPSSVYGHSEYELGIMKMFGGFGGAFWTEYEKHVPKAEPVEEWEDRVRLYEL